MAATIKAPRFTREKVLKVLSQRLLNIENHWHFNEHHGWDQVKGRGEDANRAYGEFAVLIDLYEEFSE